MDFSSLSLSAAAATAAADAWHAVVTHPLITLRQI